MTRRVGETDRDLRTTRALRDVNYVIEASFYMTDLAGPKDNLQKFIDMFERRITKGQSYRDPFLGCREFPAQVELYTGDPLVAVYDVDMFVGTMVYDFKSRDSNEFHMFPANIVKGVMEVPPVEAVC
jgi:CRISPR-associated protein Cas5d